MNPSDNHFSINVSFNDNAVRGSGPPLPRSFKPPSHRIGAYEAFSRLSLDLSPSKSFTLTHHERQVYRVSINLSINHSRALNLDPFRLASVGGNSRALLLAIVQENETRILFASFSVWHSILVFLRRINLETLESVRQQ